MQQTVDSVYEWPWTALVMYVIGCSAFGPIAAWQFIRQCTEAVDLDDQVGHLHARQLEVNS